MYYKGAFATRNRTLKPIRPSRLPALLAVLLPTLLLLPGCSDNEARQNHNFMRAAAQFQVDTARTDMGCEDPGPNFIDDGVDPSATCRSLRKYILAWQMPDDTVKFQEYRLFLDTTPNSRTWKSAQGDDKEAAVIVPWAGALVDTLVFFFFDKNKPPPGIRANDKQDTLFPGKRRVFGIDTTDRLEESKERFIFALATHFPEGTQGIPQYIEIITGDKLRPMPFQPAMRIGSRELDISWSRPRDMVSDFQRSMDTGIIAEYILTLELFGGSQKDRAQAFNPKVAFVRGGDTVAGDFLDSVVTGANGPTERRYKLPDGFRASRGTPTLRDSLALHITNLVPQDSLNVSLYALDSAGNDNSSSMSDEITVILTDTTQPSKPEISAVDSLTTQNSYVLEWTASRDSADSDRDGRLEPGSKPNSGIARYLLSRILKRPAGEKSDAVDRRDTVFEVTDANRDQEKFRHTVDYLPPGKTYLITLTAVDSSGYASATDTAEAATDSIRFAGGDSGLTCPPGFIPIPASEFQFGESSDESSGDPDEKDKDGKARRVRMQSYCIEPYEHRDSSGKFVTRVTWDEANQICQDLAPNEKSQLCSEAQWERACEGFEADGPHPHGIQSENDASILQSKCNQGTGDSVMAMSFDLRNPVCLTNEGVFDMAGNLSEWVRDYYDSSGIAQLKDTVLGHDFRFLQPASPVAPELHAFRGGNFLRNPNVSLASTQSLARCSNRDFPAQIRPKFRPDCVDSLHSQVAVVYGQGLDNFRCFPLPEHLQGAKVTDVFVHAGDSSWVKIFIEGKTTPDSAKIPQDTAFRGKKPLQVFMTPLSLAEVVFELVANPDSSITDILEASEMKFASESDLKRILDRESPSQAWTPRKVDGRYAIRKLYAHALTGTKPAKPYMASRVMGFRCCSLPRAKPASKMANR